MKSASPESLARQSALYAAVTAATDDKQAQLKLLLGMARRIGVSSRDVTAVERLIIGGPVREYRG
jgi:hypothetical protein